MGIMTADPKDAEFGNGLNRGFRFAGWKGALTQALELGKSGARPATIPRC